MAIKIFIPYVDSNPITGFKSNRDITSSEFVKEQIGEWKERRVGVDNYVTNPLTEKLGTNIAQYEYNKRRFDVKEQEYTYYVCDALIYDSDEKLLTLQKLDELYRNNKSSGDPFALYVFINPLDMDRRRGFDITKEKAEDMIDHENVSMDLKRWFHESMLLWQLGDGSNEYGAVLSDEEILKNLPKKGFKIKFTEDDTTAILNDCMFISPADQPYSFLMLVKQIRFVKE